MIDIYDLNFEYCNEKLGILYSSEANLPKRGILTRILSLFKGIIIHGILKKRDRFKLDYNKILFFAIAQNEKNSVSPLVLQLPNSEIFGNDNFQNGYPLGKIYWFSLLFIPVVFYRYLICTNPYHKQSFSYAFDGFCIAYSSNYILKKYLLKLNPKKIVIANQLSCFHRSLAYVAKELKIETIYMQHASVTENFSNLNIFSSALLEGEDSLTKFQSNGTKDKKLYLVGMPKFDKYYSHISDFKGIKSIGICTNGMDSLNDFSELIYFLTNKIPNVQIYVRPHPADRRKLEWLELAKQNNCLFSDVLEVNSFSFFENVDLIISGDSNIHLEAALLNLPSIYYDPCRHKLDWYGFAKNNLVFYACDFNDIYEYISKLTLSGMAIRNKAKYYVETVGSSFDGKSTELALKIIQDEDLKNYFKENSDNNNNTIYRVK